MVINENRYKTYIGYEFEVENKIHKLMEETIPITDYRLNNIHSYHSKIKDTSKGLWRVERDASLCPNGAEFISPPMLMEDSFKMMRKFFQAMTNVEAVTSDNCGCHTNICLAYNGKILKMNENSILCNINWQLLCNLWPDRLKHENVYCRYINYILKNDSDLLNIKYKNNFAKNIFSHYHGFIVRKKSSWNKKGIYYELRFPGGKDYHLHPEKLEDTVRHFSKILNKSRLAVCKTQNKNYNKKILLYINRRSRKIIDIPTFGGLINTNIKNINKLKNIKQLIEYDNVVSRENIYGSLLTMLSNIIYTKRNIESADFVTKIIKIINKKNVIYYIYKFCSIYSNESDSSLSYLMQHLKVLLKVTGIEFTIPKNEPDLHKLWLIKYLHILPEQIKDILIKSIKNNKIKRLVNKLTQNRRYLEPKFYTFINHTSMGYSNGTRNIER